MEHMQFDGALHWCFMISIFLYVIGVSWVLVRVLLPLRRLARLARDVSEDNLPAFDQPTGGIGEVEALRNALYGMTLRIQAGQAARTRLSQRASRTARNRSAFASPAKSTMTPCSHWWWSRTCWIAPRKPCDGRGAISSTHLKTARSQLISTIDSLRQMITNLRPTVLDELGLISALEMLCEGHPELEFRVEGDVHPLDPAKELAIFRTAQEAIRNAEHHASAKRISAHLAYSPATVTFEVHRRWRWLQGSVSVSGICRVGALRLNRHPRAHPAHRRAVEPDQHNGFRDTSCGVCSYAYPRTSRNTSLTKRQNPPMSIWHAV